jgi:hypothetical protein
MLNLFPSPGGRRKPTAARRRPEVEPLEGRLVPARIAVHNFNDGPSTPIVGNVASNLRSAIDFSHAGDEIDLDNGTYLLSNGELDVAHDLLIKNNAGGVSTIEPTAQNPSRVFEIEVGNVTMAGLKITGGNGNGGEPGGGILVDEETSLTMNSDTVTGNSATGAPAQGGGIADFGTLTLNNTTVSNNTAVGDVSASVEGQPIPAPAQGGGLYWSGGALSITNSRFTKNTAAGGSTTVGGTTTGYEGNGGGVFLAAHEGPSPNLTFTGTAFANNTAQGALPASGNGGGIDSTPDNFQLHLNGCSFTSNTAQGGGGGVAFSGNSSQLALAGCAFTTNMAQGTNNDGGGGVLSIGDPVSLTNCSVTGNGAAAEGGGGIQTVGGALTVANCNISSNTTAGADNGGGIDTLGGRASLTDTTMTNNMGASTAGGAGGGAVNTVGGDLTALRCNISNKNTAAGALGGGAIQTDGGNASLTDCTLVGNMATNNASNSLGGGAIDTDGGNVTALRCNISSNTTAGAQGGGGIQTVGGNLSLTDCSVIDNHATNSADNSLGGGGVMTEGGNVTAVRSTISLNTAAGLENGGGVDSEGGTVTMTNCTLSDNMATNGDRELSEGGGAIFSFEGTINLTNCTVFHNTALGIEGGGGLLPLGGTVKLLNTIVAKNIVAPNALGADIHGTVSTTAPSGHNLIGDGSTTGLVNGQHGNLVGNTAHKIDPRLGPLQNNGGLTPTLALLAGSPAIDAGDDVVLSAPFSLTTDQRGPGFPRKFGLHVDIGAFEFVPPPPPPPPHHGRRNGPP